MCKILQKVAGVLRNYTQGLIQRPLRALQNVLSKLLQGHNSACSHPVTSLQHAVEVLQRQLQVAEPAQSYARLQGVAEFCILPRVLQRHVPRIKLIRPVLYPPALV